MVLSTISPADVRLKYIASVVYLKTLARQGVGGQLKIPLKSRNAGFKPAHLPFFETVMLLNRKELCKIRNKASCDFMQSGEKTLLELISVVDRLYWKSYGGYGVVVRTSACGAESSGSIPDSHPLD